MAQNITLMGATYNDVPAVDLPKDGGGMARFSDVTDTTATAADVASGKYFYAADGTKTAGTASGGGGIVIPDGFGYYNGYLLPLVPTGDGYDYTFIRKNEQNNTFDCVQGTAQWRSRSAATLDNWQLEFANQSTDGARQYSIPQDGTATDWGEYVTSTNYYGTSSNRKVIWASHDIKISTGSNILYKAGAAIVNPVTMYAITAGTSGIGVQSEAAAGEVVTVTNTGSGYEYFTLINLTTHETTRLPASGYIASGATVTFTMPASNVSIAATAKPR